VVEPTPTELAMMDPAEMVEVLRWVEVAGPVEMRLGVVESAEVGLAE
jgi:hypothetical protein